MATLAPLKKNTACTLYLEVRSQADPTTFKSGPTIAAGDFKYSVDGGAYANLNTTPTASGTIITVALLAAETNGDQIKIKAEDAAGAEWVGRVWTFYTVTKQNDDLSTQASVDVVDDFLDTEISAIKAKTDNLPTDPADASDIAAAFSTVNATLAIIAAYIDTEVTAIKAKTDNLPADPADASDIAASFASIASTLSTITTYIDTEVSAIKAKTDNLPPDPADASDVAAAIAAITTTAMAESYAADGATMTPAQALYEIRALLSEFSVAGTTMTTRKKDGATTAGTYTLDSATSPTSITRTT